MSAILGRIELDQRPVSRTEFARAAATIDEYGPDASGATTSPGVALASRHLSVDVQRPKGGNPCTSGPITIVADAILDDRPGLAHAIALDPASAKSMSDAELILRAWLKWGPDCITRIIGDFAFAVWDAENRECYLVRDHIGARPLYWCQEAGGIVFATDIRAILAFSDMTSQIDVAIVAEYAADPDRPLSKTFFENTYFVHPGHYVRINPRGTENIRWWNRAGLKPLSFQNRKDLVEEFQCITKEAVACRIPTGYPVGSHLSAGIDSTIVSALASDILHANGQALTACYTWAPRVGAPLPDHGALDERPMLSELCAKFGTQLRFGSKTKGFDKYLSLKRRMSLEGTTDLSEQLNTLQQARTDGVRVLLSGWGGDEAFSSWGAGYLSWLLTRGRLVRAFRVARTNSPRGLPRTVFEAGLVPMLPERVSDHIFPPLDLYPERSFASSLVLSEHSHRLNVAGRDIKVTPNPIDFMWKHIQHGHLAMRMDTWNTWSSTFGVIHRYPLTDRRLMEFLLALHPVDHYGSRFGRHLPITAFGNMLPAKLSKTDAANEAARKRMRKDCLRHLDQDSEVKSLAVESNWIDGPRFLNALENRSGGDGIASLKEYCDIVAAVRLLFL